MGSLAKATLNPTMVSKFGRGLSRLRKYELAQGRQLTQKCDTRLYYFVAPTWVRFLPHHHHVHMENSIGVTSCLYPS